MGGLFKFGGTASIELYDISTTTHGINKNIFQVAPKVAPIPQYIFLILFFALT